MSRNYSIQSYKKRVNKEVIENYIEKRKLNIVCKE
jgi:hypothetical protein